MYYGVFIITYNHLIVNRRNVNFRNILKFYRPDAVILSEAEPPQTREAFLLRSE